MTMELGDSYLIASLPTPGGSVHADRDEIHFKLRPATLRPAAEVPRYGGGATRANITC